jgi:hypothetical protein
MFSAAYCYVNGQQLWGVWHDSRRGRYDLSARGALPPEFTPIKVRLTAEQKENDRAAGNVDCLFDVPVELAFELTSYRYDRWKFDWVRRILLRWNGTDDPGSGDAVSLR